MSKKLIAISLAVLVIGLFSTVAMAGVEGDFEFDIDMKPTPVQTCEYKDTMDEIDYFKFDFQGLLDLNITLSGLTTSHDLAMGIGGVEHYIADIETTLGALSLKDEFVFAAPYGEYTNYYKYTSSAGAHYMEMQSSAREVATATGLYDWSYYPRMCDLQFVKKRVNAEITLAGLTVDNLFMFEDVSFYHPTTSDLTFKVPWCNDKNVPDDENETCDHYLQKIRIEHPQAGSLTRGDEIEIFGYYAGTGKKAGLVSVWKVNLGYGNLQNLRKWVSMAVYPPGCIGSGTCDLSKIKDGYVRIRLDRVPDQKYRFGDILTLSGETVSGISVTSKSGFDAGWSESFSWSLHDKLHEYELTEPYESHANKIKKKSWDQNVEVGFNPIDTRTPLYWVQTHSSSTGTCYGCCPPNCPTNQTASVKVDEVEEINFFKEMVGIEGISVGGLTFNSYTFFHYPEYYQYLFDYETGELVDVAKQATFQQLLETEFSLFDLADFTVLMYWKNPLNLLNSGNLVKLETDLVDVLWADQDGSFSMNDEDHIDLLVTIPIQTVEFTGGVSFVPDVGPDTAFVDFTIGDILEVQADWEESTGSSTDLTFEKVDFTLTHAANDVTFEIDATFDERWLKSAGVSATYEFAL